jgi:hypothetical protein
MQKNHELVRSLQSQLRVAIDKIDLSALQQQLADVQALIQKPDFWQDPQKAQQVMRH